MRRREEGFALIGLVVAIFLILLVLAVAAPRVAQELRREREVESVHRANQYVRAIRLYYLKFGHYPGSLEQLEKTNNIRFLRQKYLDPMTGKSDWRVIHVGEAKTTIKGFFGKPLTGLTPGLGSAAGLASAGAAGAGATGATAFGSSTAGSAFGGTSASGAGSSTGNGIPSGFGSPGASSPGGSSLGSSTPGNSTSGSTTSGSSGIGSQSATDFKGSGGAFVGIGSVAPGNSILELNEQTTYGTWEFLYDPRIEQLKAKASLFGGGPASASATGLGSASGNISPGLGGASPTTTPPTTPTPPTPPTSGTPRE